MDFSRKEFKYIYNKPQALFFSNNGGLLEDVAENPKSNTLYYKFINNEKLQELYLKWGSSSTNR